MATLRHSLIGLCALLPAVISCSTQKTFSHEERETLLKRAATMRLAEKYALHEKVVGSRRPPQEFIAPVVAADGKAAYNLALSRIYRGDANQIAAAIPVISETKGRGVPCEPLDISRVRANVERHFGSASDLVTKRIKLACVDR